MAHYFQKLTPRGGDFPYIDRVDVYKYRNDFDYFRWAKDSTLTLCNVPFPSDFSEIVDWGTPAARDEELARLEHYTSEPLPSNFRLDKNGVIKVPLPFDVADASNYIIVRNGQAATVGAVDYEKAGGVRDLFFFILDCEQLAPNTTRLTVKLDVWTTYFDRIELQAGYVERGHAPMWHSASPEDYLADPLQRCDHLTAADISVDSSGEIVTWNRPTLLDTSEHLFAFALEYDMRLISEITEAATVANVGITRPSYSGDYSENVGGFEWNLAADSTQRPAGFRTVKNAKNRPPQALGRNSLENAGAFIYAVYSSEGQVFFEYLFARYPHLAQNIEAVFLVPSRVIEKAAEFEIGPHNVFMIRPKQVTVGIHLTPEHFAFDAKYAGLTKLYTSPYSKVVLTDLFGGQTEVKIQDTTSRLSITLAATLLSGCTLRAELAGVGGATGTYRWNVISIADRQEETILEPKAGEFFQQKQLPVYRVTMSAATRHDLANAKLLDVQRQAAILGYQNGQRSAGTALANTRATLETNAQTALASNRTAYDTGLASAVTAKGNANRSADNGYSSAVAAIDNGRANDLANIAASRAMVALENQTSRKNRDIEVDFMRENNVQQQEKATFTFNVNRQNRAANLAQSADYQAQSLQNQQAAQAANVAIDAVGGTLGSVVSGAMSGGLAGAAAGLVGGLFNAGMNVAHMAVDQNAASAETTLSIWNQTEMAEIETETDRAKINNAAGPHGIGGLATDYSMNTQIAKQFTLSVGNMDRKLANTINARNAGLDIQAANTDAISTRTTRVNKEIAGANRDTAKANASDEYNTTTANLLANKTTADSNVAAQKATGEANADRSYQTTTTNAQASLMQAGRQAAAGYDAAAMAPDIAITQTGGDGLIYDMRRDGFGFEVRTPNRDAVAQLGDFFLRYGYAANRMYDMSRLSLFTKFTYWQASEVMLKQIANAHIMNRVKEMFRAGVTVWRRMEDVGTFCIYDNEKEA